MTILLCNKCKNPILSSPDYKFGSVAILVCRDCVMKEQQPTNQPNNMTTTIKQKNKLKLVFFTGHSGAGKSEAAKKLEEILNQKNLKPNGKIESNEPFLKYAARGLGFMSYAEDDEGERHGIKVIKAAKDKPYVRQALRQAGVDYRNENPIVVQSYIAGHIDHANLYNYQYLLISGARYIEDIINPLTEAYNYTVVRIKCREADDNKVEHETESGVDSLPYHYIINNSSWQRDNLKSTFERMVREGAFEGGKEWHEDSPKYEHQRSWKLVQEGSVKLVDKPTHGLGGTSGKHLSDGVNPISDKF